MARDAGLAVRAEAAGFDVAWAQLRASAGNFAVVIDEEAPEVANAAIELIVEKIRRFETGLGGSTRLHLVKGTLTEQRALERRVEVVA